MKVTQNGKEVKGAQIIFSTNGTPVHVVVDGLTYDASAYDFKDDKAVKKTRVAPKQRKNFVDKLASVMTTKG